MNSRVSIVTPTEDYKLHLVFSNGEEGIYDCHDLLNFGVFEELRDRNYFKQVMVLHGTVAWPHDQDICPDTLYLDSQKVKMPNRGMHPNDTRRRLRRCRAQHPL